MFALKTKTGEWVLDSHGKRFIYTERRWARLAAKILGKRDSQFYTVTDA